MSELPPDMTDAERATVAALRAEADAVAAKAIAVRRAYDRARARALGHRDALSQVVDVDRLPVSVGTAERIVQRRGAWSA